MVFDIVLVDAWTKESLYWFVCDKKAPNLPYKFDTQWFCQKTCHSQRGVPSLKIMQYFNHMTIPFRAEVMKTISSEELLFPTEERKKLKYKNHTLCGMPNFEMVMLC